MYTSLMELLSSKLYLIEIRDLHIMWLGARFEIIVCYVKMYLYVYHA